MMASHDTHGHTKFKISKMFMPFVYFYEDRMVQSLVTLNANLEVVDPNAT